MKQDCVEFDGCCTTHGACFTVDAEEDVKCEGWPCPESEEGKVIPELLALAERVKTRREALREITRLSEEAEGGYR